MSISAKWRILAVVWPGVQIGKCREITNRLHMLLWMLIQEGYLRLLNAIEQANVNNCNLCDLFLNSPNSSIGFKRKQAFACCKLACRAR